ncbi:hypothetical protein GCM10009787_48040 [Streptomyces bangladeshensis]|uniref:Uncharacterized protein n=1 Tax=Streptomyces bangladeshensis TaxID=295352 RepID=A0ABN3BSD5_9ACTN
MAGAVDDLVLDGARVLRQEAADPLQQLDGVALPAEPFHDDVTVLLQPVRTGGQAAGGRVWRCQSVPPFGMSPVSGHDAGAPPSSGAHPGTTRPILGGRGGRGNAG